MVHDLKIYPEHFQNVIDRKKPFEIRSTADRTFNVGDKLRLREFENINFGFSGYTGREVLVQVLIVHTGLGMLPGFACLGIEVIETTLTRQSNPPS